MQTRDLGFAFLLVASAAVLLVLSVSVNAQNTSLQEGWNGAMQSLSTQSQSFAFVDGVGYVNDGRCSTACDICQIIKYALTDYNPKNSNGVIIDTRGIGSLTCTSTDGNPWSALSSTSGLSNIVLLPAGTIAISSPWILPNDTRLIGEGPNITTISASSTLSPDMIDMGYEISTSPCYNPTTSAYDCPGVVIEHLGLNGSGNTSVNGIVNCCSQEFSRVNDVKIVGVNVGLALTDQYAQNSGPYTNLTMSGVSQCVTIESDYVGRTLIVTRGVHGLSCSTTGTAASAIQIDTSSNSLEDIYISGGAGQDGVLIGSQAPTEGNVLVNITGSGLQNVVHISSANTSSDISILGVSRSGGTNTIYDQLAGTTLTDANLGMYILGEPVQAGTNNSAGYSRFTTSISANAPTWFVGGSAPTGSSCGVGDLYSCTGTTSACTNTAPKQGTVWECLGGGTTWYPIK
jgi:hypothetical protein